MGITKISGLRRSATSKVNFFTSATFDISLFIFGCLTLAIFSHPLNLFSQNSWTYSIFPFVLQFLKPLLRFLCNKRAAKVAADDEARAQNAANEALEAALQGGLFHAAPDRDIALCGASWSHQRAEEQHSPSLHSVHDDQWFTY